MNVYARPSVEYGDAAARPCHVIQFTQWRYLCSTQYKYKVSSQHRVGLSLLARQPEQRSSGGDLSAKWLQVSCLPCSFVTDDFPPAGGSQCRRLLQVILGVARPLYPGPKVVWVDVPAAQAVT